MSETLYEEHGLLAGSTHDGQSLVDNSRFAFLMMLAVDIMLFAGLLGGYFVLRGGVPNWPPIDLPHLNKTITGISCSCLAIAAGFMWLTVQAQTHNELTRMRVALVAAMIFLLLFLGLNLAEWTSLLKDGYRARSAFGAIYFIITGVFHTHIAAALLYTGLKLRQTLHWRRYTRSTNSITHLSFFYYTLLAVWLGIFGVIYL